MLVIVLLLYIGFNILLFIVGNVVFNVFIEVCDLILKVYFKVGGILK